MTNVITATTDTINEGADLGWTLARIPGQDGFALHIVDVDEVAVFVFDDSTPEVTTPIYMETGILPADVFFDTLQDDRRWQQPDQGYNFRHYLSRAIVFAFTDQIGGHSYRIEYQIVTTPTNASGTLQVVRVVNTVPLRSPVI